MFRRELWICLKSFGGQFSSTTQRFTVRSHQNLPKTLKMSMAMIPGLHQITRHHSISECPGQIQVIFGPMFSGKTTELLRRIKRYQVANHKCLVIKYAKDDRYDAEGVATHDRQSLYATPTTLLYDLKKMAMKHTVIGIDEGQFFPDVVDFAEEMAGEGKTIIIAALDGTFQRKAFGNILNLVPLAESVVKLSAVCMNCYKDASFTKRLGFDKRVEVIGGADKYMSVCRECYTQAEVQDLLDAHTKYRVH